APRVAATEGPRWIPRELLLGQVRVVLELPGWLDDVDAPAPLPPGELSAPDRGVESCAEVDVVHRPAGLEVRFASRDQQIAHREVRLRTVQVHARLVHLERHRLTQGVQATMLRHNSGDCTKPRTVLVLTFGATARRLRQCSGMSLELTTRRLEQLAIMPWLPRTGPVARRITHVTRPRPEFRHLSRRLRHRRSSDARRTVRPRRRPAARRGV